jgi:hypothetical protein
MTPDEKIDLFMKRVDSALGKYRSIQSARVDLSVERTMKVIDQKVAAVGEMIESEDRHAAERCLDRALDAVELLNTELDFLSRKP